MEKFEQFALKAFSGCLSANPECKYNDNGLCICKFSIPLKKSKDDNNPIWLNAVVFGKLGEEIAEKYEKGSYITILGYFKESNYNEKIYLNFIVAAAL